MPIAEGQTVGNYQILSRIGGGGMGSVFLAEHPLIGKKVALKVIHGHLLGNKEVLTRFFHEARAVNKIGNEHIVEIHDFGVTPEGEHFFIMEHLPGRTLASALEKSGVLEVGRAVHIAAQVAHGLAAAHSCGIIHRDLKPDNVMLIPRMGDPHFVKVLDFGLAKTLATAGGKQLTAQGVVLGTPQYMSPEAAESKGELDHRSDIYSLGILLFQMVAGRVPFDGSMSQVLIQQVAHTPPAPRGINPEVPPAVEQIILRCLAKAPDERFPTMAEVVHALRDPDGYLAGAPAPAASASAAAPQARTVMAVAASRPEPPDRHLALPAPAPSSPGAAAENPTRVATGAAGAGDPTRVAGAPAGGAGAAADADTAFMHAHPAAAGAPPPGAPAAAGVPAQNRTMAMPTPAGHVGRARRRLRVVWIAGAVVGTAAAGALAAGLWARDGAAPAAAVLDAAVRRRPDAAPPPADAAPPRATVRVTTVPEGAEIVGGDGRPLGVSPTDIRLPIDGRERTLRFRHPRAEAREKSIRVTGDMEISVELPPRSIDAGPRRSRRSRPSRRRKPPEPPDDRRAEDGVLAPEF